MLVALGWGPHTLYLLVPRSSAIRRSGSTSPLGFARASPSPPSHAEHGAALARKLSLGGGRPYTPSPQGEPVYCWETQPLNGDWVSPPWGRGGSCSPSHLDPGNFSFPQVGTIPERPGWSGAPSPQASEMRGGRSPRPGGCSPSLIDVFEGGAGEGQRSWAYLPGLACHCLEQWLSSCPQLSFFFFKIYLSIILCLYFWLCWSYGAVQTFV